MFPKMVPITKGTPDKAACDKAQIGDRLEVRYRYIGNEKEIISIRNLSHPDG